MKHSGCNVLSYNNSIAVQKKLKINTNLFFVIQMLSIFRIYECLKVKLQFLASSTKLSSVFVAKALNEQ